MRGKAGSDWVARLKEAERERRQEDAERQERRRKAQLNAIRLMFPILRGLSDNQVMALWNMRQVIESGGYADDRRAA